MNWRKGFCTFLIVTAEAQRVYEATHPRTRKQGPGTAGQDESSLEPLRIDEPRGGDDGLRELLTPPMPIKSPTRLYDNIENELLRELATSAESPAEAFVKSLFNPSPATQSKTEELLRAATAEASLAATATQAKESALENEDLRELPVAESRAVEAEASLASFKESAANDAAPQSEVEALREQDESEDAKGLLRRLSECNASQVQIFTECYDPDETFVDLSDSGITGPIPTEIGLLAALTSLYLLDNGITGTFPTEIGQLTKLKKLWLNRNKIEGPIPTEIGQLTALGWLDLENNKIEGSIPTEFGLLTALNQLYLDFNKIEGSIPPEIGKLTNLGSLWLEENEITGTFPPELCGVATCKANSGNDLVAPCGTTDCCDLDDAETCAPTGAPTVTPSATPSDAPSATPSDAPTAKPSDAPSAKPSDAPSAKPSDAPTAKPSDAPTAKPSERGCSKHTKKKRCNRKRKCVWIGGSHECLLDCEVLTKESRCRKKRNCVYKKGACRFKKACAYKISHGKCKKASKCRVKKFAGAEKFDAHGQKMWLCEHREKAN